MIVCLDANCVIYLVENHAVWGPKVATRLISLRSAYHTIAVADLSRTECAFMSHTPTSPARARRRPNQTCPVLCDRKRQLSSQRAGHLQRQTPALGRRSRRWTVPQPAHFASQFAAS